MDQFPLRGLGHFPGAVIDGVSFVDCIFAAFGCDLFGEPVGVGHGY
jgi:hypothetical protein